MFKILSGIFILSGITGVISLLLAIFNFIKLDRIKGIKMLKFTGISIIILCLSALGANEFLPESYKVSQVESPNEKHEEKPVAKVESTEDVTWLEKVKEVASLNSTPQKKFDTIEAYAKKYPVTKAEIKEFEDYIVAEYKNKKYLADVQNNEYMLANIFKAYVVNRYYGEEETPINDFVFGFYQNSNYTFKGLESINSNAIKHNERQMDKALTAIEN
ncbi:hypothetical protein [Lysinibacillus xylanilyticus]|uniref:hypothetical protein n=1 Tax=Lysinibacillus xylanilyticus TaxID=582475 RepID=UPI003CFCC810